MFCPPLPIHLLEGLPVANPLSSVTSAYHAAQVLERQSQARTATPSPKQEVIPQDTVSISQSAKAASQAQAATKGAQPFGESESDGDSK